MLNRIVQFSLRFRGVVVVLACVLVGYGIYVASNAKLDVFPNFVPPEVTVETEAPGLSPEQVEVLVTRPLESTINGLGGMDALRSESSPAFRLSPPFSRKERTSSPPGRCFRNASARPRVNFPPASRRPSCRR